MTEASLRSPVLSLTVVDGQTLQDGVITSATSVLAVARSPAANPTHPHVVSVPTQRIPIALHDAVLSSAILAGKAEEGHHAYFWGGEVDSDTINGHSPVVYAVESLLQRKLGLAEPLEAGRLRFRAALRSYVDGAALYDNLGQGDVYEQIRMTNVLVELSDWRPVPMHTESYSMIGWTAVESFIKAVEGSDVTSLGPQFDPIDLCVHGVCLAAARETLQHVLGRPAFATEPVPAHDELVLRPGSLPGAVARTE